VEVKDLLGKYFGNSYSKMVAHFAQQENISQDELESIIEMIQKTKS
ncbi:MAG: BlaI/MecI/CopY family transcriptional regulator, partial [Bacteroidia bacterium]|nr:BlaI/MecI/CopY family transcriptional regulator [Bacteroidia bacterium]